MSDETLEYPTAVNGRIEWRALPTREVDGGTTWDAPADWARVRQVFHDDEDGGWFEWVLDERGGYYIRAATLTTQVPIWAAHEA